MLKSVVVGGLVALALFLVPAGTAAPHGQIKASAIKRFVVHGVYTREQRSQLVTRGLRHRRGVLGRSRRALRDATRRHAGSRCAASGSAGLTPDDFPPPDSGYHNYAEMVADVQAVAAAHPSTVHLFSLGTSYEGRDMIGVRISNDATDNLSEPGVFFVGQHHAREHLTVEVVLSLMHLFAGTTPNVPTGHAARPHAPDLHRPEPEPGRLRVRHRHRLLPVLAEEPPAESGAIGTDKNRNYSYRWGCCGGSSGNGGSETYRGPNALSTPEDQRMARLHARPPERHDRD